jgi:3-dehydroquinate dehydratase/shikimate dehydrogenase
MPAPLICATVTAATMAELRHRRDTVADADLVELRLDTVTNPDVEGALADRRIPVLLTCRPRWEGGEFDGSEEERKNILRRASTLGAEFIDIEWRAGFQDLVDARGGRGVVLSAHHFDAMPADLPGQIAAMRTSGAQVVKLAVAPVRLSDCVPLLEIGAREGRNGGLVLVGMGDYGLVTRVLAGRFGSTWTYAGSLRQIGQLSVESLVDTYRFRSIDQDTDVYGLAARSIVHSVSPSMHNAAFSAAGINAVYVPMAAESADDFLTFADAIGLKGASVTIPHKVAMYDRMDSVDARARGVGAVNTIRRGECWSGTNTDVVGFLRPLQQRVPADALRGFRASLLGAGGAARAVATALTSCGSRVVIHARDRSRAAATAGALGVETGPWPPERGSWDLLVNCTPVGICPRVDETPIDAGRLTGRCVYDLIYNPPVTRLLREAASAGCETIGGLDMLVEQGVEQFHWWTGRRIAPEILRGAALARLAASAAADAESAEVRS